MIDVLVAGAGPVGLLAGLRLAQAGLSVVVVERDDALGLDSKASTFHPATLDLLDSAGVAAELLGHGVLVDRLQWRDLDGGIIAEMPFSLLSGDTRFPYRLHAEQTLLTPILARDLAALPHAEVRFGHTVTGIEVDAGGASVRIEHGDAATTVRASYVVAADGARSTVRTALGIGFPGNAYPSRALRVITTDDLAEMLPGVAGISYVRDRRQSCSLLRMVDHWRFIFRIPGDLPDAELTAPAFVRRLVDTVAPGVSIAAAHTYSNRVHVADTFAAGRVAIVGDAAHLTTTAGGMNMNCGLHDAYSVADAIVAERAGADGALADAAARRRRAVTEVIVPRTESRAAGADGDPDALDAALATLRATAADPGDARRYLLGASMFDTRPEPRLLTAE